MRFKNAISRKLMIHRHTTFFIYWFLNLLEATTHWPRLWSAFLRLLITQHSTTSARRLRWRFFWLLEWFPNLSIYYVSTTVRNHAVVEKDTDRHSVDLHSFKIFLCFIVCPYIRHSAAPRQTERGGLARGGCKQAEPGRSVSFFRVPSSYRYVPGMYDRYERAGGPSNFWKRRGRRGAMILHRIDKPASQCVSNITKT